MTDQNVYHILIGVLSFVTDDYVILGESSQTSIAAGAIFTYHLLPDQTYPNAILTFIAVLKIHTPIEITVLNPKKTLIRNSYCSLCQLLTVTTVAPVYQHGYNCW